MDQYSQQLHYKQPENHEHPPQDLSFLLYPLSVSQQNTSIEPQNHGHVNGNSYDESDSSLESQIAFILNTMQSYTSTNTNTNMSLHNNNTAITTGTANNDINMHLDDTWSSINQPNRSSKMVQESDPIKSSIPASVSTPSSPLSKPLSSHTDWKSVIHNIKQLQQSILKMKDMCVALEARQFPDDGASLKKGNSVEETTPPLALLVSSTSSSFAGSNSMISPKSSSTSKSDSKVTTIKKNKSPLHERHKSQTHHGEKHYDTQYSSSKHHQRKRNVKQTKKPIVHSKRKNDVHTSTSNILKTTKSGGVNKKTSAPTPSPSSTLTQTESYSNNASDSFVNQSRHSNTHNQSHQYVQQERNVYDSIPRSNDCFGSNAPPQQVSTPKYMGSQQQHHHSHHHHTHSHHHHTTSHPTPYSSSIPFLELPDRVPHHNHHIQANDSPYYYPNSYPSHMPNGPTTISPLRTYTFTSPSPHHYDTPVFSPGLYN